MRSWGRALIQYDWYPYGKGKCGHRRAPREECVNGHWEDTVWRLELSCHKTRRVWGYQKLEEASKDPSYRRQRDYYLLSTLCSDFQPPELWDDMFWLCQPPRWCYLVTAAPGNEWRHICVSIRDNTVASRIKAVSMAISYPTYFLQLALF